MSEYRHRCACGFESTVPGAREEHQRTAHPNELVSSITTTTLCRPDGKPVRYTESGMDAEGRPWFKLHPEDAEALFGEQPHTEGDS